MPKTGLGILASDCVLYHFVLGQWLIRMIMFTIPVTVFHMGYQCLSEMKEKDLGAIVNT